MTGVPGQAVPEHDVPALLAGFRDRPESAALCIDFDGTLSVIVEDATAARPLSGVPEVLAELAGRFGLVAIVSGRPVAFLRGALGPVPGVHLVGLYGMEDVGPDGKTRVFEGAESWRSVVADVTELARLSCPVGAEVEPKGLTVCLHWRRRPDAESWARIFAEEVRVRTGLIPDEGRMAIELRPPIAVDKGSVVRRLGRGHAAVAVFGDDLGDLPAFAALDDLAIAGITVARIAVVDAESPEEVAAAADVIVEGAPGAVALLKLLALPHF